MKNGFTAVVCIDDRGGMTFNKRRQSKDRVMLAELISSFPDKKILINDFSAKLFADYPESVLLLPSPLDAAEDGDVCFIENLPLAPVKSKIARMIIYKWNRHYPQSTALDVNPEALGLSLVSSTDFVGSSHEKITKEIYE